MKTISIKQPWASLIMYGYKGYEFRSWKTNYRGRMLIHVSKNIDKQAMKRFEKLNLEYPVGVIMGEVDLTDCVEVTRDLANKLYMQDDAVYKNVFDYGKLGLWEFEEK